MLKLVTNPFRPSEKFRPARLEEYIAWLKGYLEQGGAPTHYYHYVWRGNGLLVAQEHFRLDGECGSNARCIVIPRGIRRLDGELGHNTLYFFDGFHVEGRFVPIYANVEFKYLPVRDFVERERKEAQLQEEADAARRALENHRRAASDLGQYTERNGKS